MNCFAALPDWVQVELIVFQNTSPDSLHEEQWPSHPALPVLDNAIELQQYYPSYSNFSSPESELQAFQLLPASEFKLTKEETKLNAQKDFNVLLHLSWKQPVETSKSALPVHITNIDDVSYDDESGNTQIIDGTVLISKKNYLNFHANLSLKLPLSEIKTDVPAQFIDKKDSAVFHLLQTRKMRPNEKHYLDHPLFGVIVLMTPVELPGTVDKSQAFGDS